MRSVQSRVIVATSLDSPIRYWLSRMRTLRVFISEQPVRRTRWEDEAPAGTSRVSVIY